MRTALSKRRFWLANFLVVSLFLLIFYQVFQLTVFSRSSLLKLADRQHLMNIEVPPLRGQIVDRNGKELATNLKIPSVYAVPRILTAEQKVFLSKRLSKILNLKRSFIEERLGRDKAFVWIKRQISFEEAETLQRLKSPAIGIIKEFRRFYPQGELLSQVLGFTNIDNVGIESLELTLNRELQGRAGQRTTKRDAFGREIRAFELKHTPTVNGNKVVLTLDQYLQYLTERALESAYKKWKAKGAMAVVLEAKTGKILAMANRPNYDPNHYEKSIAETRRNRVVTDMFEPGSIFKIVAASAALNENLATPATSFFCENGEFRYYKSYVLHDVHPHADLSFEDVIVKSSNIGIAKIAGLMEPEVFHSYVEKFGFGKKSGVDLPGEANGVTRHPKHWSKTSPFIIPMGQEVMVTALQMASAMSVIANGGEWIQPTIVERVEDQAGVTLRKGEPQVRHRVIRPEVAAMMQWILQRVVEEGTGRRAKIKGIPVAGKTGTAQKLLPDKKGYSHENFISSFLGFAPANDPEYVMAVILDDPQGKYYGGTVAAPVFKEVMETYLLSMGYVPEDAPKLNFSKKSLESFPKSQPMFPQAEAVGKGL